MANLRESERELFCMVVQALGGYQACSQYLTDHAGVHVNAAEVWRAANGRGVSARLMKILNPPKPRIRYCIECANDANEKIVKELKDAKD